MPNETLPPFQKLLDEHGSDVLGFLVASVGPHDAEDCFQETFIAALRAYSRLQHGRNLHSWLLTIAHRKAIDHHRASGRRAVPAGAPEEVAGAKASSNHRPDAVVAGGDPELWTAVSGLPPKQRSDVTVEGQKEILQSMRSALLAPLRGQPGLAVPVGSPDQLRTGVPIMSMRNREDRCLDAGEVIEAAEGVVTPIDPDRR